MLFMMMQCLMILVLTVYRTRQLGVGLLTELNQDSNGSDTCVPKDIDHGDMIDRNSSSSVSSKDDSIEVKHFIEVRFVDRCSNEHRV